MLPEEIDSLPLPELIDLLVENTVELLGLSHQKGIDGITIRDKRFDVQLIQSAIANKKIERMQLA